MKLKPPADATDFKRKFIEQAKVLSGRKYAETHLMLYDHLLTVFYGNGYSLGIAVLPQTFSSCDESQDHPYDPFKKNT